MAVLWELPPPHPHPPPIFTRGLWEDSLEALGAAACLARPEALLLPPLPPPSLPRCWSASGLGQQTVPRPPQPDLSCTSPSAWAGLIPPAPSLSSSQTADSSKLRSAASSQEHAGQVVNREKIVLLRCSEGAGRFISRGGSEAGASRLWCGTGARPGGFLLRPLQPSPEQDPTGREGGPSGRLGQGQRWRSTPVRPSEL